jgi:Kef-type K+ transport system membrane component KefB
MIAGAVAVFLVIRSYGETLTAPAAGAAAAPAAGTAAAAVSNPLLHVLLALTAVVVIGRLFGRLLGAIGQPPVIGEVLGGIFLGPSVLGRISPEMSAYILPPSVAPYLGVVAQVGVILYMFLVGLELSSDLLKKRAHAAVATSHASIVLPFVLGSALALVLYPRLSSADVPFTSFALFMGVAMSVTAFPVLARILKDRGMTRSELGVVALTCAAADDVTAWCLLALVVGVAQATIQGALVAIVLTVAFIAFMFLGARPVITRLVARRNDVTPGREAIALTLVGVLLSALTTEHIGIHAIFGAFLFGAIIPHDSALARTMEHKMEDLVTVLLLPAFFAFTGMRTEIGLIPGMAGLAMCAAIILVATTGKLGGTLVAARLTGLGWREAASLGILMNTRGLMGLIVLNVGLDMGVISPTLFTMMVIMAVVTTLATTPVLQLLHPALQSTPVRMAGRRAAEGT